LGGGSGSGAAETGIWRVGASRDAEMAWSLDDDEFQGRLRSNPDAGAAEKGGGGERRGR